MANNKELFLEICRREIKRDGIEELLEWLKKSDFFTAPASTKYHGSYEGGLCAHSLNVANCLVELLENHPEVEASRESAAICSLFHDICKVNFYKIGFRNVKDDGGQWVKKPVYEIDEKFPCGDHADKSIIILQSFIKLLPEEILAIRAHMGGFDTSVKGGSYFIGKIFEKSKLALLLHLADMQATYLLDDQEVDYAAKEL